MNSENLTTCLLFPMGMELGPFLHRVEVQRRWKEGKATFRTARFEGAPLILIRSGVGPARAAQAVRSLRARPAAILCVGLAGALSPELRVGDLIVASETVSETAPDEPVACSPDLVERVENACRSEYGSCGRGRIVTVNRPAFSRKHRERLHRDAGAVAVDMETHAAGLEARKLGIPFVALRVISDDFGAVSLTGPPGFRKLRKDPRKLLRVLTTAWHWARFLRDVRRVVHMLPPVLVGFIRDS
jgi:nucleoside phosphorylase